ncbi:phosphatase PAP2 family protein [Bradyrhizobium sp. 41S5]|uniref:acid phosphatase n=1 Tax=Bradyrhizobium sp. 41S5 TaxID=1404443 RepID=UPI001E5A81EA|nr:phosphatase PAP2 family protein [Bradyrhizobium sp. 41S5]UFX43949.1 phosphatase PAP2 family protein [Bradyrhizobium sp. 41S5]
MNRIVSFPILACMTIVVAGAAVAQTVQNSHSAEPTDPHFNLLPGYLKQSDLPDSLKLLSPPPAQESAALARDEEARQETVHLRGSARWELAVRDAKLNFPRPAETFSCAMGIAIDEQNTPHLYTLMQKMLTDVGLSTYGVKNKFHRTRPFVEHAEGTCTPGDEEILRTDGSYPSGHSAVGWGWALALAEINPERSDEIFARGLAFGQSRVICNAHWQSDVETGRIMAAATVSRLHADTGFLTDLQAAREEASQAREANLKPRNDCAAEAASLSVR